MLYIDPTTCIDCGLCAEECPVDSIYRHDSPSAETHEYVAINAEYYEGRPPLGPAKQRFTPEGDRTPADARGGDRIVPGWLLHGDRIAQFNG
jgi:ferredoxin--NADP+ reductase